ncbi:PilN domain-containing protein [Candidatus Eisenbacteria bacterium]|uniref:PilN domain-containing protein n=1 Tax=Eiseniibacteriota bacterium TaxID=2212470 RepID=A0ABV6YIV3_UNCEI
MSVKDMTTPDQSPPVRTGAPRRSASQILILPRTQVLERLLVVPTSKVDEIKRILQYRIPSETPFLVDQIAWTWKISRRLPDGSFLVRVLLVEKERIKTYLKTNQVDPGICGILVEDDFLTIWQRATPRRNKQSDESDASRVAAGDDEVYLYRLQDRLLATLVHSGECLRSSVLSTRECDPSESAVAELIAGLSSDGTAGFARPEASPAKIEPLPSPIQPTLPDPDNHRALSPLKSGGWLLHPGSLGNRPLAAKLRSECRRDLLPEEWEALAAGRKTLFRLLGVAAVLLLAAVVSSVLAGQVENRTHESRRTVDETRAAFKEDLKEVEAAQMLIERVESWSNGGRSILAAWNRVSECVPKGVTLTGLTARKTGTMTVHGTSPNRAMVIELMDALQSDTEALFDEALLTGLEERDGKQVFHISITMESGQE